MSDLMAAVGSTGFKCAVGAAVSVIIFALTYRFSLSATLAALGMVPVGAFVVGSLLALTVLDDGEVH